jgi:hypothetical protein
MVVMVSKIPKSAVKPLMEHCERLSGETGRSAADIFREYLELMKKYADFFFSEPWPEKLDKQGALNDEYVKFIEGGGSHEERCERFTLVCLRRNMSVEGFDSEGFREDFKFYGGIKCWCCSINKAAGLREQAGLIEKHRREMEQVKWEESSEVVKQHKMLLVGLRLYEELGGAGGRSCRVKIKYACPYGEESEQLIEKGRSVETLWKHIEWYDCHWNASYTYRPSDQEMKWYHYGEPSIIDVTSYDDVLKAREDGRLERIIQEHERYMKETGREIWAL